MNYPDAHSLGQSYGSTQWLIKKHADGLTTAESTVQPPFQANCFNWVLGHILAGRYEALSYLGGPTTWGDEELARYKTGSPAITSEVEALPMERLLDDLDEILERIVASLEEITTEEMTQIVETRFGDRPLGQHIYGLHWHETYHTGQLEILGELSRAK